MFKIGVNQSQIGAHIAESSDSDFARFLYCQHIYTTYLSIAQFEQCLISLMLMCDRIKVQKVLKNDLDKWEEMLSKKTHLQASTIGSLIKILENNNISHSDISYLKWVRDKRDYFIHRMLHEGFWPGDLDIGSCHFITRRLMAIQIWLKRAQDRTPEIFKRAGLVQVKRLEDGILISNVDLLKLFGCDND